MMAEDHEFEDDDDFNLFDDDDDILNLTEQAVVESPYADRKGFVHKTKAFPQEDGTVVVECACGWGTTAVGWSGEDENGNEIGAEASKFVPALSNAHLLSQEQWPYKGIKPVNNWPNQPPKKQDEGEL